MTTLVFGSLPADMTDLSVFGYGAYFPSLEPVLESAGASLLVLRDPATGSRQLLYGRFDYATPYALYASPVDRAVVETAAGELLFDWSGLATTVGDVFATGGGEAFIASLLDGDDQVAGSPGADVLRGDVPRWHEELRFTPGTYWQWQLDLSDNGRFIAGVASHQVPAGEPGDAPLWRDDVVVLDRESGEETWVSLPTDAVDPRANAGFPSLSGDGRYVAFQSEEGALGGLPAWPRMPQVYVSDLQTGELVLASSTLEGAPAGAGATLPMMSANGRFVVFQAKGDTLLSGGLGPTVSHVYVKDLQSGVVELVDFGGGDSVANRDSGCASISADGRTVAFLSNATNLVEGVGDGWTAWIYVKDLETGELQAVASSYVSIPDGTGESAAYEVEALRPALSADGRYLAFVSPDSSLVEGDTNGVADVFIRDLLTGGVVRASVAHDGAQLQADSLAPEISADGSLVAFETMALDAAGEPVLSLYRAYFLRDLASGEVMVMTPDTPAYNVPAVLALAADGSRYAYLDTGAGQPENVFVRALGGTGRDTLAGGGGDDLYLAEARDLVVEAAGAGRDTVATSAHAYVLPDGVEQLVYVGAGSFDGTGNALDNLITGGMFADALRGAAGLDLTWYPGIRNDYAILAVGDAFEVSSLYRDEGTDRLFSIERIALADRSVALDLDGAGGQAYRIYKAAFDRAPDQGGLGYWIAQLDAGESLLNVASGFVGSDEFASLYGENPTNEEYTRALYLNVLDREPEQAGYAYWNAVLNGGPVLGQTTREQMLVDFSESGENQDNVIGLIGNGIDYLPWG